MNKAKRPMRTLLRLLPLLLLAGGGAQAWDGSADIEGRIAYSISGDSITVEIERIANNTSNTTTGTLYVTVRMTASFDLFGTGYRVARHRITGTSNGQLEPGHYFGDIQWNLAYQSPPQGTYHVHLYTSQHPEPDTVLDSRPFANTVEIGGAGGSDDHGDTRATATRISLPSTTRGTIGYSWGAGDEDYFRFEVADSSTVVIESDLYDYAVVGTLFDAEGIALDDDGAFGTTHFRIERTLDAGTYYVRVTGLGSYWLHLRTAGDDHGNTRATATRISLPSTTGGTIDPGEDEDYFRFEVAARSIVVVESASARQPIGLPSALKGYLEPVGTLFDASGNSIVRNSHADYPNFRIERTLDAGTYYVRVHSFFGEPGAYALHLRTGEHGNTRATATRISLPSTTAGTIDPGEDEDYFRFEVAASSTVVMESGGGLDAVGTLFGAGGNRIALDDDGGAGSNFRMERTLDPGTYYIRVHSYWAAPGAYALHLRTGADGGDGGGTAGDDHGNTRATATRISLPSTTAGTIDPGNDTDHFRFVVPARGVVVMESTGGLDTVGTLFNVRGGRIVQDDDGAGYPNFRIEGTLDPGTYYVRVHSSGRATGGYALRLRGAGGEGGDGLRISTATGSAVEPFQQVSLAVEGGTADADYDILMDFSGTGAFEAEDTIEVAPVGAAEDRLLMAAPLPEALAKGNAARLFAVRVRERARRTMSTPLTLTLGETNVPASLAGQPTAILDVVLKEAFESLDDPLLTVEAAAIAPGRSVRAARALGLNTSYSDAQAEALLRSLFGISLVEPGAAASDRNAAVRCGASAPDALCDAYRRLADCVGDAMDAGIDSGESLDQCARSEAAAVVEAWDDYGENIRTAGNFLGPAAPRLARNLGVGEPAQQLHDLNATVRQVVGATKTLRTITERTEDLRDAYEAMRDATQALTEGNAELVTEAGQEIAADGVDDAERDAYFALVEEADRHYSDAAAIEELEGVYTGAADVAETLGTVADGGDGTSGGATCGPDYEEFPVGDKTSTCVWESLVEWNCYAGSRQVSHPDLGGANACLYDSLDFPQPDGTCRENYAKVAFLGRETCRWAELGAVKAAWFTLEKEEGVKSPQTPPGAADGASGESFRDCDTCPPMVSVPAGSFSMGAPESEPWSESLERPQRTVSVPAFAIGAYEVTFADWDRCVAEGGCGGYSPPDGGWGRGDQPVIDVSWDDAQLYVAWLSRKTGETYRLPTEAEWEYAARAGTTSPFNTGGTISLQQANFDGSWTYPDSVWVSGFKYRGRTVPVGTFAPNAFGLHDVHGNVWEWVQDCYFSYEHAPSDGRASEGRGDAHQRRQPGYCDRVVRGGSESDVRRNIRSANRGMGRWVGGFVGFRVARTLTP